MLFARIITLTVSITRLFLGVVVSVSKPKSSLFSIQIMGVPVIQALPCWGKNSTAFDNRQRLHIARVCDEEIILISSK